MDQLSVHSDKEKVKHLYGQLNIMQILNIGYSPEFNCIESCFSQVKRIYNRERLKALANEAEFDEEAQIKKALKVITRDLAAACTKKSLNLLKRDLIF